ncbi:microfibril-associated glycoprotein 4-like [Styela clava]
MVRLSILTVQLLIGVFWLQPRFTKCNYSLDSPIKILKDQLKMVLQRYIELKKTGSQHVTNQRNCNISMPLPQLKLNIFHDCEEVYAKGNTQSGVYMIHIFHGLYSIPIYCDMETIGAFSGKTGWMTIQKRVNGEVNFDRGWSDYLQGFGFPNEEHWVGLRNLHNIVQQKAIGQQGITNLKLRIDIEDREGRRSFMEHDSFNILTEEFDFRISNLGRYLGTTGLGNHMRYSLYSPFSTHDHNTDPKRTDTCVQIQRGGWWFGLCNNINLNGVYPKHDQKMSKQNIFLRNWRVVNPNNSAFRYVSIKLQ